MNEMDMKWTWNGHGQIDKLHLTAFLHGQDWHLFSLRYVDMHRIQQGGALRCTRQTETCTVTCPSVGRLVLFIRTYCRYLQKSWWFIIYLGKKKHVCDSFLSFVDFRLLQGWSQLVGNASIPSRHIQWKALRTLGQAYHQGTKNKSSLSPRQFPFSALSYPASWEAYQQPQKHRRLALD